MGKARKHFGAALVVLTSLWLCAPAVAAENAIRMPVDKNAAPDPLGEMLKGRKPAAEKQPEAGKPVEQKAADDKKGAAKSLEPDGVARGEAKKPDEKKIEQAQAPAKKPEDKKPEARKQPEKQPEKPSEKKVEAQKPAAKQPAAKLADKPAPEAPAVAKPAVAKPAAAQKKSAPAPTPKKADNATDAAPAQSPAPSPAPAPAPAPAPKPAPKPPVDPVAFVMPAGPSGGAPAHVELPTEGLFLGDLTLEFQHTQIILRAATSREVERVTYFYLKDLRRLALDLRGNWGRKGPATLRYETGPVKHIVTGEHPDRLRVVLEFREGAVRPDLDPVVVRETGGGVTVTIPLAR